jgi:hypothetical protein
MFRMVIKPRHIVFVVLELLLIRTLPLSIIAMLVNLLILLVVEKVERGNKHDAPLTTGEKWMVIPLLFLNLVIADAFFYFCWKKKLPTKASQANKYAFVILGVWIVLIALYYFLGPRLGFGV